MSLLRQIALGARSAVGSGRRGPVISFRCYAKKHNPTPTCMNKKGKKKESKADECADDHPRPRRAENIEKTFPFYHLIKFKKECCDTDCIDKDFPSFDDCLYVESDKNKRRYQVTWVECPPMKIAPKKICCFAKAVRPPIVRRKPMDRPETACKPKIKCESKKESDCPRIKMPGCRPARAIVKCSRIRYPSDCVKISAPYPSFSECDHVKLRKRRRNECHCFDTIPMCDLLYELNRRLKTGKTGFSPCSKT